MVCEGVRDAVVGGLVDLSRGVWASILRAWLSAS